MFEPRPDTVHHYERPLGHPLSDHDRQQEPVSLCEAVASLVCGILHVREAMDRAMSTGQRSSIRVFKMYGPAVELLDRLPAAVRTRDHDDWVTEAEITTGMLMATVDMAR
jgi:hypothetical protein